MTMFELLKALKEKHKLLDKNVKLLECNPRIQGGTCLSNKLGFNFIDLYLQLCNNAYSVANLESYRSRCESLIGVQVSR